MVHTYRRNKFSHQIITASCVLKSKNVCKNNKNHKQPGNYSTRVSKMSKLYCKQVRQTKTFTSYRTSQIFQIKGEKYLLLYVDYKNFNMLEK